MEPSWQQVIPDKLNLDCDCIFRALDTLNLSLDDQIGTLEQCLDYLRLEQVERIKLDNDQQMCKNCCNKS